MLWTLFDAELWGGAAEHCSQAEAAGEVVEEKLFPLLSLPPPAYLTLQLHMWYTALRLIVRPMVCFLLPGCWLGRRVVPDGPG